MDIYNWLIANGIRFEEKRNSQLTIYSKSGTAIARVFPNDDKFIMDIALQEERYGLDNFKYEILEVLEKL